MSVEYLMGHSTGQEMLRCVQSAEIIETDVSRSNKCRRYCCLGDGVKGGVRVSVCSCVCMFVSECYAGRRKYSEHRTTI